MNFICGATLVIFLILKIILLQTLTTVTGEELKLSSLKVQPAKYLALAVVRACFGEDWLSNHAIEPKIGTTSRQSASAEEIQFIKGKL